MFTARLDIRQGPNPETDGGQSEDRGHTTEAIYSSSEQDFDSRDEKSLHQRRSERESGISSGQNRHFYRAPSVDECEKSHLVPKSAQSRLNIQVKQQ